jgi:type IV pilus biogenesis protein CpaD/CtpE
MHRIILAVMATALLLGCGRNAQEEAVEKAIEKQTGGDARVNLSDDGVSVETEDGEMRLSSGNNAKLPENFPDDVYVMEDATVEMAMNMPEGQSVALSCSDTPSDVAAIYRKKMVEKGWKQMASTNMGEQVMLVYTKGNRAANVVIARGEEKGRTRIHLTIAMQ